MKLDQALLANIRATPIADVAKVLGIEILHGKAMCFSGHDSKTPSFTVSNAKNLWKCHGCGKGGDTIELVREVRELSFLAAYEWLRSEFHSTSGRPSEIANPRRTYVTKSSAVTKPALIESAFLSDPELYGWLISRCGKISGEIGMNYLVDHGIDLQVAEKFGVVEMNDPRRAFSKLQEMWGSDRLCKAGIASSKSLLWSGYALLFPFRKDDSIEYFQVRTFGSDRKFFGPKGIPKPIYNVTNLKTLSFGSTIHICEGIPDTLALEGKGIQAVGILGASSFRTEWVDEFMPFELVGVPDGDSGGSTFRQSLKTAFEARSKSIRFVTPPKGMDASDVISKVNNA